MPSDLMKSIGQVIGFLRKGVIKENTRFSWISELIIPDDVIFILNAFVSIII